MPLDKGDAAASVAAAYAQEMLLGSRRGAVPFWLPREGTVLVALFGNDDHAGDARARREVALVRHALDEASLEEVGFGLSEDGRSWALLVADPHGDLSGQTGAGRLRLLAAFLGQAVREAWRLAAVFPSGDGPAAGEADPFCVSECSEFPSHEDRPCT